MYSIIYFLEAQPTGAAPRPGQQSEPSSGLPPPTPGSPFASKVGPFQDILRAEFVWEAVMREVEAPSQEVLLCRISFR